MNEDYYFSNNSFDGNNDYENNSPIFMNQNQDFLLFQNNNDNLSINSDNHDNN